MKCIKYSVIIPVWNGKKTLRRCLDSILFQQRKDVEVIVVDDGSTDGSRELIQKYSEKYPCIQGFSQYRKGVAAARNTGLERCCGVYVLFVDCDDYVDRQYFEQLDQLEDKDLWVFARKQIQTGKTDQKCLRRMIPLDDFSIQLENLILERKMLAVWNKRFKTDLIRRYHLRYREGYQIAEDALFCLDYALCCHSIGISSRILYYQDTENCFSLSRKYRPELNLILKDVYQRMEYQCLQERNLPDRIREQTAWSFREQERVLSALDYLYVRNIFACIGEEFKVGSTAFPENLHLYASLCTSFNYVIGAEGIYVNWKHRAIRYLLAHRQYYLLYAGTWGKVHIYERMTGRHGQLSGKQKQSAGTTGQTNQRRISDQNGRKNTKGTVIKTIGEHNHVYEYVNR